ncbi:OmpA family protein [Acetobacteroides hydrogenigenes]|uniref:Outer membrane protein OmpA-like peptidoglycan-associated protein n=1 Tax=Acetobacteroides hydrogenigenes TaxID=979970 RepID=A0A4R2EAS5_9BACT|nr:OmpA family protein [Acetobacteroides hydrogenigenes]TCN63024.1 outer membrane protein OmpA-like peptidoglycan-associated protein [Acetobacteroides hydrogenigenes]
MIKIYKTTLTLLLATMLAAASGAAAQTDTTSSKHSLEVSVIPSFSKLSYKSTDNSSKGAFALGVGIGYTYHLTERWGLGIGLRYQSFTATYQNKGYQSTSALFPEPNGHQYTITQTLDSKEKQRVSYLIVPLTASYRYPLTSKLSLKAAAGAAYALNMKEKMEVTSGTITRTAYFPNADLTIDNLPEQTIGTYTDYINRTSDKQFKNAIMGIGELGAEYTLNERWLLAAGISTTLGGDIKKQADPILQQYSYAGVTASNYVGSAKPVSVGLSLGVVYRFARKSSKPAPVVVEVPVIETPAPTPEPKPEIKPEPAPSPAPVPVVAPAPEPQGPTPLEELQVEVRKFNASESVQFRFNSKQPQAETKQKIGELVQMISEAQVEIVVVGHACNIGSTQVNYKIGLERANRVKQYLVEQGLAPEKIEVQSMGEKNPKFPNNTPENRAKNRRVEIIIK